MRAVKSLIPALILFTLTIVYRLVLGLTGTGHDWSLNFAPVAAIALCAPMLFPRRIAFALPLGILLVSDFVLNAHYNAPLLTAEMFVRYAALLPVIGLGVYLAHTRKALPWLAASAAGSVFFYLVTNSVSWMSDPGYVKNVTGWVQALTVGLPGLPPTWVFFRNTLVSDLLFTGLMLLCTLPRKASAPSPAYLSASSK